MNTILAISFESISKCWKERHDYEIMNCCNTLQSSRESFGLYVHCMWCLKKMPETKLSIDNFKTSENNSLKKKIQSVSKSSKAFLRKSSFLSEYLLVWTLCVLLWIIIIPYWNDKYIVWEICDFYILFMFISFIF